MCNQSVGTGVKSAKRVGGAKMTQKWKMPKLTFES
jgi:hypothetical protein